MAQNDQEKWDRKYLENARLREPQPPVRWIEEFLPDGDGATALDLACGTGRNSILLAQKGWRVEAVDFSPVALQMLTEFAEAAGVWERIDTELIDLERFSPTKFRYGTILIVNFLDRELIRRCIPFLETGGLFIVETHMEHPDNEQKESNPDYLLRPGELRQLFSEGFQLLHYEEFRKGDEGARIYKQAVVAKKM